MKKRAKNMSDEILINLEHVYVVVDDKEILHDISFDVSIGQIITIIGPNGSGKSTLIKTILGIISPIKGQISIDPKVRFGYVPQEMKVNPILPMTVEVFLKLNYQKGSVASYEETCELVGIKHICDRQLYQLSGGEKQKVLLAKALLEEPTMLILDEPIQGMDVSAQDEFYQLIETLRCEKKYSILMVSHDLYMVMKTTDQVICINRHICCSGTVQSVIASEAYQSVFGQRMLEHITLYNHQHDHTHDLSGNVEDIRDSNV